MVNARAEKKRCVDCRVEPETMGEGTTLVSLDGWRLTRTAEPDGTVVLKWRCPMCWVEYRRTKTGG